MPASSSRQRRYAPGSHSARKRQILKDRALCASREVCAGFFVACLAACSAKNSKQK